MCQALVASKEHDLDVLKMSSTMDAVTSAGQCIPVHFRVLHYKMQGSDHITFGKLSDLGNLINVKNEKLVGVTAEQQIKLNVHILEYGILRLLRPSASKRITEEVLLNAVTLLKAILPLQAGAEPSLSAAFVKACPKLTSAMDPDECVPGDDQRHAWELIKSNVAEDDSSSGLVFYHGLGCIQ